MGCSHSQHSEGESTSVVGVDGAKEATAGSGGIEQAPDEAIHLNAASDETTANEQDPDVEPNVENDDTSPDQTVHESCVANESVNCSGGVDCIHQDMPTSLKDASVQSRISRGVDSATAMSRSAATSVYSRERNETTILSNGGISLDTCKVSASMVGNRCSRHCASCTSDSIFAASWYFCSEYCSL
jgi:hypothetical protein